MRKLRLNAPASVVAHYFHLFVNRRAYTLRPADRIRKAPGLSGWVGMKNSVEISVS